MNYQNELDKIIEREKGNKKKLLLHVCCAPCLTYVLEYLYPYFEISIYFYNPNINSKKEYNKRYNEILKYINKSKLIVNNVIKEEYNSNIFIDISKGLEHDKEGGFRCSKCFYLRLEKTFEYAYNNHFDYVTTTLTISPYKNSMIINEIGKELEEKYKIKYLYSDFKKKEGYKRSIELSNKYNLYRQDYCGCEYSIKRDVLE